MPDGSVSGPSIFARLIIRTIAPIGPTAVGKFKIVSTIYNIRNKHLV